MSFSRDIKIVAFKYFKFHEVKGSYFKQLGKVKISLINDRFSDLKNLFTFRNQLPYCTKDILLKPLPVIKS